MRKIFIMAFAATAALFAEQASATVVNVSAFNTQFGNYGTPVTNYFLAGTYNITYGYTGASGQYQGWDAAASNFGAANQAPAVSGCNAAGGNCGSGWTDSFGYNINGAAGATGSVVYSGPNQYYATAALALTAYAAALPLTTLSSFTLTSAANVTFFIPDASYNVDNYGGVTLQVTAVPSTAVPEPASLALLGFAFTGLGLVRRRRNPVTTETATA